MPYRELITGVVQVELDSFSGNNSGNAPVLLMLGGFKFSLNTAVFTELNRDTSYKWPGQERIGQWDALQFTGPGEDRIRLPGIVYPMWNRGAGPSSGVGGNIGNIIGNAIGGSIGGQAGRAVGSLFDSTSASQVNSNQLRDLRSLASQGRPLKLISSSGEIMGAWVIEHIEEGQSYYNPDGSFRRQEFSVTIRKYGDVANV